MGVGGRRPRSVVIGSRREQAKVNGNWGWQQGAGQGQWYLRVEWRKTRLMVIGGDRREQAKVNEW